MMSGELVVDLARERDVRDTQRHMAEHGLLERDYAESALRIAQDAIRANTIEAYERAAEEIADMGGWCRSVEADVRQLAESMTRRAERLRSTVRETFKARARKRLSIGEAAMINERNRLLNDTERLRHDGWYGQVEP